jgi:hypothetical protein
VYVLERDKNGSKEKANKTKESVECNPLTERITFNTQHF